MSCGASKRAGTSAPSVEKSAAATARLENGLDWLSVKLRKHRMAPDERRRAEAMFGEHAARAIYDGQIDRWLDHAALKTMSEAFIDERGGPSATAANMFLGRLDSQRLADGTKLYYLPHQSPEASATHAPCAPNEVVQVAPWWAPKAKISLCASSYRPETAFDGKGYCGGQADPLTPTAPRPTCGCGPVLLACMPPVDEAPDLVERFNRDIRAEVSETAARVMESGGSYADLLTASATWQTGLVRFLYVRRELLGQLFRDGYDARREEQFRSQLAAIDLDAPGKLSDRPPEYAGSGVFYTTPMRQLLSSTYRVVSGTILSRELCRKPMSSVRVTSAAILLTTHGSKNLGTKEVHESPMRSQEGCKNCHGPMDNLTAFMLPLTIPNWGSIPTGREIPAKLYVAGPDDYRGTGAGYHGLMELVTHQPEFDSCTVQRFFGFFVGRAPDAAETEKLLAAYRAQHRALLPFIKTILRSDAFAPDLP